MKYIPVEQNSKKNIASVITQYQTIKQEGRLLMVEFTSLGDYLHLLRAASQILSPLGNRVILYLAAAVSDFYIPADKMVIKERCFYFIYLLTEHHWSQSR